MFFGAVAVQVQMSTPAAGSGYVGNNVLFGSVGVGIYQTVGQVVCTSCIFYTPRLAAVGIVASTSAAQISLTWSVWVNIKAYVLIQATPTSQGTALALPASWAQTYVNLNVADWTTSSARRRRRRRRTRRSRRSRARRASRATKRPKWWNIFYVAFIPFLLIIMATISLQFRNRPIRPTSI